MNNKEQWLEAVKKNNEKARIKNQIIEKLKISNNFYARQERGDYCDFTLAREVKNQVLELESAL